MSRANLTSHDLIQLSFAWQIHGSVLFFSICLMGYYLISDILKQKQCIYLQKTKYLWQWPAKCSVNRGKSVLNLPTFSVRFSSYRKESSLLSENWTDEKRTLPNTNIPNPFMIAAKDGQSQNSSKFLNFICFEKCWEKKYYVKVLPKKFQLNAHATGFKTYNRLARRQHSIWRGRLWKDRLSSQSRVMVK